MGADAGNWEQLRDDYLHEVERRLRRVDHPRKREVLDDLRAHLAQRFAELSPEDRTPDGMKALIEGMGPADEYAELLSPATGAAPGKWYRRGSVRAAGMALLIAALAALACISLLCMLAVLDTLLFAGIAVALVVKYRRTGDTGFLWLGLALVVWPLLGFLEAPLVRVMVDRTLAGEPVVFPFSLVAAGRMSIGSLVASLGYSSRLVRSSLVLLGILHLYRGRSAGRANVTEA